MVEKNSETQRVELRQMMKKTFFSIAIQPGPPDFAGFQNPTRQTSFPGGKNCIPQEISYFDPFYDQKATVTGGFIEHAG